MPLYAIEIILTRTVSGVELKAARRAAEMPLAPSHDSQRIMTLVTAASETQAIKRVWRRLRDALPIDVLCTVLPGPDGRLRMSVPFPPSAAKRIHAQAAAAGQPVEEFLGDAVRQALARDRSSEAARRACLLNSLLAHHASLDTGLAPGETLHASSLPPELSSLAQRVFVYGGRVTIVDRSGPIAVLIGPENLAALEDRLMIAERQLQEDGLDGREDGTATGSAGT
ncbi:hypothetical protein OG705_13975 [Streptomyces sp. NBC_00838]|uniref:hypothetical protein n=1 Tax=Streptomyces sp. NBC_00838 TaxID=2903680 RepID=UPI003864A757|nr:hypothetical protein OG705_13975 [Streptomyces sp. NBC_00838]